MITEIVMIDHCVAVAETGLHLFTSRIPTLAERHTNSRTVSKFAEEQSWSSMLARRRSSHLHNSIALVLLLQCYCGTQWLVLYCAIYKYSYLLTYSENRTSVWLINLFRQKLLKSADSACSSYT